VEHLAAQFAAIAGVEAVVLGGSRARGEERPDSDWDFGLYYRGDIDTDAIRALGYEGEVFAAGGWGHIVNGGAWLTIDGVGVDLIYRDLDAVEAWVHDAEAGRFAIEREVGYAAGIPTYTVAAELALNRVLIGDLPRPAYPVALRERAPAVWSNLAAGALHHAEMHADRGDAVACATNLGVAVLQTAHARCAAAGQWVVNEKGLVARAGLRDTMALLAHAGEDAGALRATTGAVTRSLRATR
jgi:predicted nucleotidyltransferase